MIETIEKSETASRIWDAEPLPELIHYILDTHHIYTRQALPRLQSLAEKVRIAHAGNHPELCVVERLVAEMTSDLLPHMLKEEQVLFPYVLEPTPRPFFGTVRNPIRMMQLEHETAGEKLVEMRELTMDYAIPDDACASYRALYDGLIELEADLHQHIHLENNILFPRALKIETDDRLDCHCA